MLLKISFGWFATPVRPLPENWLAWEYQSVPEVNYENMTQNEGVTQAEYVVCTILRNVFYSTCLLSGFIFLSKKLKITCQQLHTVEISNTAPRQKSVLNLPTSKIHEAKMGLEQKKLIF